MIIDLDDIYNKRQYNPSSYEVVVVDSEVIVINKCLTLHQIVGQVTRPVEQNQFKRTSHKYVI